MAFNPADRKPPVAKETPRRSKYSAPSHEDDSAAPAPTTSPARRGNPDYRQISAQIPKELHKRFKAKALLEDDSSLTMVLEQLIRAYVEGSS